MGSGKKDPTCSTCKGGSVLDRVSQERGCLMFAHTSLQYPGRELGWLGSFSHYSPHIVHAKESRGRQESVQRMVMRSEQVDS